MRCVLLIIYKHSTLKNIVTYRAVKVCDQSIQQDKRLKFYGVNALMSIVHHSLMLIRSGSGAHSPIDKTKTIIF